MWALSHRIEPDGDRLPGASTYTRARPGIPSTAPSHTAVAPRASPGGPAEAGGGFDFYAVCLSPRLAPRRARCVPWRGAGGQMPPPHTTAAARTLAVSTYVLLLVLASAVAVERGGKHGLAIVFFGLLPHNRDRLENNPDGWCQLSSVLS